MGQEFQVPAIFQNKAMAGAFAAQLNAQDDNLAEGIGQSYGVIGYKGKVWSLRYRGQRHNFIRPDDGTLAQHIDVVILQQAHSKSKSFYKVYVPGQSDGERPICASIDGIVPDADVQQKQCESCALCPRNEWKADPKTGKKRRECTDYKRLAVLLLPTQTKQLLGEPLLEPVFLRVPPASLNSLAIMGDTMAGQGFHFSSYITRITFDAVKPHPEMVFRPLQQLSDDEAPVILKMREEPQALRITGGDLVSAGVRAVTQALSLPGAQPTGLVSLAGPQTEQTTGGSPNRDVAQAATQITARLEKAEGSVVEPQTNGSSLSSQAPSTSRDPTMVDTGFGGVTSAQTATPSGQPQNGAPSLNGGSSDAGEPEESDADLDARIASLITK